MKYFDVFIGTKECIQIDADRIALLSNVKTAVFHKDGRLTGIVNINNVTAILEGDTDDDLEELLNAKKEQEAHE